jgi:hypothetical protein
LHARAQWRHQTKARQDNSSLLSSVHFS